MSKPPLPWWFLPLALLFPQKPSTPEPVVQKRFVQEPWPASGHGAQFVCAECRIHRSTWSYSCYRDTWSLGKSLLWCGPCVTDHERRLRSGNNSRKLTSEALRAKAQRLADEQRQAQLLEFKPPPPKPAGPPPEIDLVL
jgi:hypothetical protein